MKKLKIKKEKTVSHCLNKYEINQSQKKETKSIHQIFSCHHFE